MKKKYTVGRMSHEEHAMNIKLGEKLKLLRTLNGISQQKIGELLNVSIQQVQKYEKGFNRLSAVKIIAIINKFNVEPNFFFISKESFEITSQYEENYKMSKIKKIFKNLPYKKQVNLLSSLVISLTPTQ